MWENSVVQWFRDFRQRQGQVKGEGANPAESQTPSTVSLRLYAVYFSKDLGSHLTPPPALLPQGTKVREDGDNSRRPPCLRGGRSGDWPHRVCSGEQGMGMGGPKAALRWREGTWKSLELDA